MGGIAAIAKAAGYRVTRVDYSYSAGDDKWVDPFYAEDQGETDR